MQTIYSSVIILGLIVLYVAFKMPKSLQIARSRLIQATAERLFPYLNNPRKSQEWNPFTEGDPKLKMSFEGPEEGVGAQATWDGKNGAGTSTILKSVGNQRVELQLDFKRPFNVTNFGEYGLQPEGPGTRVTWIINETAWIPRLLSVVVNLEKLIGTQFEKGLLKLSTLVEVKKSDA